jgi:hypothetical protein
MLNVGRLIWGGLNSRRLEGLKGQKLVKLAVVAGVRD